MKRGTPKHLQKIAPKKILMTIATFRRLKDELKIAEKKLTEMLKETGAAAGEKCDWHDNASYDQAVRDAHFAMARVGDLKEMLAAVKIITPREETNSIEIGNAFQIILEGNDLPKEYTLLGPNDSGTNPKWLSVDTPLGCCLLGKKIGETVEYQVGERKIKVYIKGIYPGKFEYGEK